MQMCSSIVSVCSKACLYKYGARVCYHGRRRLGGVECGSALPCARGGAVEVPSSAPVEVTDIAMEVSSDYRCCLRAAYIHTRAVEPLVPYVDNIHEVIKKPFVAKGPPQFAMKACNSSFSCSMCQAASVANPAC